MTKIALDPALELTFRSGPHMVIDLGEVRDELVAGNPRPIRGRYPRAFAVVAIVLALLTTGGAAAPVRPVLVEQTVSAAPGGEMQVVGDVLLLVRWRQPGGMLTVEAYRLGGGEVAWRWSMPQAGGVGPIGAAAGALLLTLYDDAQGALIIAMQPTTGRELWRRSGWWQPGASGQVIVQQGADQGGRQTIEGVAVDTGQVRWSLSLAADQVVNVGVNRLVGWSPSGRVEVRHAGTGRLLAAATLPVRDLPTSQPAIQVTDRLLLVSGRAGVQPTVTAYGLDALDRRWRAPIDLGQEYLSDECGDALCFARMDGGVRLVDAVTGATRWSDPRWGRLRRAGSYLVADVPMPPRGQEQGLIVVLDPATGKVVADLGRWSVTQPAADGRMAAVRHEPGTFRAVVALIDPATARARVASVASDVVSCEPHVVVVACRRLDGSVVVWRLPVP